MNDSATQGSPDAIADGISAINRLFEQMNELYHAAASKRGLSSNAFSILYALYQCGSLSQKQLSDQAYIPKQTVSYTAKKLREEGLVAEEPVDGRENRLRLTECGRSRVEADVAPVMEAERAALSAFDKERRRAIVDALGSYVAQLKDSFVAFGLVDERPSKRC